MSAAVVRGPIARGRPRLARRLSLVVKTGRLISDVRLPLQVWRASQLRDARPCRAIQSVIDDVVGALSSSVATRGRFVPLIAPPDSTARPFITSAATRPF